MLDLFHGCDVPERGLYPSETTDAQYHGDRTRDSFSTCKVFLDSIPKYHERYSKPHEEEESESLEFGSLVHCMIFEPEKFPDTYHVAAENVNRATKEGKAKWKAWQEEAGTKTLIKPQVFEEATALSEAFHRNKALEKILELPKRVCELPIRWTHKATGLPLRSKVDFLALNESTGEFIILDLKTTKEETKHGIKNAVWYYRYYIQQPFYLSALADAMKGITEREFLQRTKFYFVFLKTSFPESLVVSLTPEYVHIGHTIMEETLQELAFCKQFDVWNSRDDGKILTIDAPTWSKSDFTD